MTSRITRTQVIALVVIAVLSAGLVVLRANRGPDGVPVPNGAHAGRLKLHSCDYDGLAADCGTLVVPENRRNPRSRLIGVKVVRVNARSPHPGAPIFRLEGGPGLTNLDFPYSARYAAGHDVVLAGYR